MEQLRGGQAFPASDLYSLGVTCIQLLTARMPDELYNPVDGNWIWREILAKKGASVSDHLGKVLDKILQERPSDRYQSAAEVLQDLNASSPVTPAKVSPKSSSTTAQPAKSDMIALELEALKSQMSQAQPPAAGNQSPPSKKAAGFDPVEADLESLKTEFGQQS